MDSYRKNGQRRSLQQQRASASCSLCDSVLLHRVRCNKTHWFCPHCRIELSETIVEYHCNSSNYCASSFTSAEQDANPLEGEPPERAICAYNNKSDESKLVRINDVGKARFGRSVLPRQRLVFEAPLNAELEVSSYFRGEQRVEKAIACRELAIARLTKDVAQKASGVSNVRTERF